MFRGVWQEFHVFYHSLINKLLLTMKNMPDTFSFDFSCLQNSDYNTVTRTFSQIKSANMHTWNISQYKRQACSLHHQWRVIENPQMPEIITTFPWPAASKACWLTWLIFKIPKILHVFAQNVPCKFAVAPGFEKNWLASKRFMSSLLHEMSSRVSTPLHTQGCQKVLK